MVSHEVSKLKDDTETLMAELEVFTRVARGSSK